MGGKSSENGEEKKGKIEQNESSKEFGRVNNEEPRWK